MTLILGHHVVGSGPKRVIILNDWIGDTTSWNFALPLFDRERFSWALVDLRGYGRSRSMIGTYLLEEAACDILHTAEYLGWDQFSLVGHSMSTLPALHIGQIARDRVQRIVLIAPPPPTGMGADEATISFLCGVALGDRAQRVAGLDAMWGDRLSKRWRDTKADNWHITAAPDAVAAYIHMFASNGLPDAKLEVCAPVLAITGEQDVELMRAEAVRLALSKLCLNLVVSSIQEVGHYPMQEAPPLTYTIVERFLESVA